MNRRLILYVTGGCLAAVLASGLAACSRKTISSIDRKEAANVISEAQFATTVKDFARAESLAQQAATLCPDTGDYWLLLGTLQVRNGKKSDAKASYRSALDAYKDQYKDAPTNSQLLIQQAYVLVLMGRPDDARAVIDKAHDRNPDDWGIKKLVESKVVDHMVSDPSLKALSL